jgi:hypothetical protein|tara:strand:+ start:1640 stop:2023 length:384 start_codon:yes stop_codon:yes gene_type:complete
MKKIEQGQNMNETFKYHYVGIWSIHDEETREHIRDENIVFEVECEYPPKVWNEMEIEGTDAFHNTMSDCYSEVIVDYDCETEYHEGCEDYWRVGIGFSQKELEIIRTLNPLGEETDEYLVRNNFEEN